MAKKHGVKKKKQKQSFAFPSHTKGYYRFSKEFPSVTDSEGYRDNDLIVNSPAKKASLRRRLVALFLCIFVVSFTATYLCFTVSKVPVAPGNESSTGEDANAYFPGYNAVFLSGTVLSMNSAESIIGDIRYYGYDTVVIDFKDATGNFYFDPSINVASDALAMASADAQKIVKEFQEASISVFARFSLFADDIYARVHKNEAAYVMTVSDENPDEQIRSAWYNKGDDSHAWLNPYSSEVQYYLRCCVEDINAMGVDGIIFDYATLPAREEGEVVMFDNSSEKTPDEAMTSFISLLNNTYVSCTTAVKLSAETMLGAIRKNEAPAVCNSGCDYIVPDARLSLMPADTIIGTKQYKDPSLSPKEFITDYINAAKSFAQGEGYYAGIIPILDASGTVAEQLTALSVVNNDSFILYSADSIYSDNIF